MMRELADNDTFVSFEGWLSGTCLQSLPGVTDRETTLLYRCSFQPRLDFLVVPLMRETVRLVWCEVSQPRALTESIIHVQIAQGDRLIFGAYDNFGRDCVVAYEGVPLTLLEDLTRRSVIRSFKEASDDSHRWHD